MDATHRKLRFPQGSRRYPVYASHYRFGPADGPAPLVVYVGGATMLRDYLEREATEPVPVRDAIATALRLRPLPRLDALVCPCPQDSQGMGTEWFVGHLDDELLPALPAPPTGTALVGYSAGAACALRAGVLSSARAISSLGGAGVDREARSPDLLRTLEAARSEDSWTCDVGIFLNAGDPIMDAARVAAALRPPLRPVLHPSRPGGHGFADYAANGTAAAAFRFALERLGPEGAARSPG